MATARSWRAALLTSALQLGFLLGPVPGFGGSAMVDAETREREAMVAIQIEARGIADARVLAAMRKAPRHRFVPRELAYRAYEDGPLPIGAGQRIEERVGRSSCVPAQFPSTDVMASVGDGAISGCGRW